MAKTNKSTVINRAILKLINGDTLTIEAGVILINDDVGISFETDNVMYFAPYSAILYLKQYADESAATADTLLVYEAAVS